MSTRVVDRVDDWAERSFDGGYRELRDLADREFSGVVRAGGAELCMINGVVVDVRQGSLEDFDDAGGTIYEAPSPGLPLLAVMQERGGEVRDQFYTEKTSISEVDNTLSEGGFTGYIELSENVLSGDYYLVYHAGRSMSVGFVGESGRLIDGDEAFRTADDEVGIYKIHAVDVEPVEIPEPAGSAAGESAGTTASSGSDASADTSRETSEPPAGDRGTRAEGAPGQTTGQQSAGRATEQPPATGSESGSTDTERGADADATETAEGRRGTSQPEPGGDESETTADSLEAGRPDAGTDHPSQSSDSQVAETSGAETASDLEQRAIPSLDPDRSDESTAGGGRARDSLERSQSQEPQPREPDQATAGQQPTEPAAGVEGETQQPQEGRPSGPVPPSREHQPEPAIDPERVERLEADLEEREAEIGRLEGELASATAERDELREELTAVRAERDELQAEVERLEGKLDRVEEELGATTEAERRITGDEALSGTDVFVRYHSKGDATLEKAHGGSTRREDVNENLRLEKHTQFDSAAVAVGAQSYAEHVENTVEYQFVEWVVRQLLFEIRETGHQKGLTDLYDVLPAVDRAELSGIVEAVYTADGQETRSQESFDIILRDRMGNPLLVANLNDSREAATADMMEDLVTAAERVGQSADGFAGAFLVTRSFFDPGALEVAEEVTQSGLLSRDKRKSFVNLSRKQGYHLCLVEARNENFHLAVPEL
jgi:hypothetical protein